MYFHPSQAQSTVPMINSVRQWSTHILIDGGMQVGDVCTANCLCQELVESKDAIFAFVFSQLRFHPLKGILAALHSESA
jgi:hypothetical protein